MKNCVLKLLLLGSTFFVGGRIFGAAVLPDGTKIGEGNATYEGLDVVISNATVTIDGVHSFNSLVLTNTAVLTHSACTISQTHKLDLSVSNQIVVDVTSSIDVSGLGYLAGRTTGNTTVGGATGDSGGSFGGLGQNGFIFGTANAVYGDYSNPNDWGSGGGTFYGNSSGGGLVRLTAGSMFLDGQILADGQNPASCYSGGSGGGIYVSVQTLAGAGQIRAGGAASASCAAGAGGGGQVAVYARGYSGFNLASITAPSGGFLGGDGTVYVQGTVTVNLQGPATINTPVDGIIPQTGSVDQWTFLGRAGELSVVELATGSKTNTNLFGFQPFYGFVQLLDPATNVLAQTSVVTTDILPGLFKVTLPATLPVDGSYTVTVYAPPRPQLFLPTKYRLTVWDATPATEPLVMNQEVNGQITTPYSTNFGTFTGTAGQQIQFDLINESSAGVSFNLTGPNGWTGFSNQTTSSGLLNLPHSGAYSLSAFSAGNAAYNISYAFELLLTAETNISPGGTYTGTFVGNGQPQLLALTVTNSGPLLITLNNMGGGNLTELYLQLGTPPTRGTFGWESVSPNSSNQQILVTSAVAGTYYILIYGNIIRIPGNYTVQVLSRDVFLTTVVPGLAPNNVNFTVTLTGSGFLPASTVALTSSDGTSFPASTISVDSFTQITANFGSNAIPTGLYSVRLSLASGESATLSNCFQLLPTGAATFTSSLLVPPYVRPGVPGTAYPQYANTGNAAMPAPLLVLSVEQSDVQGARLGLDPSLLIQGIWTSAQPLGFGHSAQFLASGQIPGVLQPGESKSVPVYWAGWETPLAAHSYVNWHLGVLKADDPTPVDWPSLAASMQPSGIPADAWNAIFTALTNEVGATWGSYVTTLDDNASYLGRLGLNINDLSKLLPFLVMQADGLCPMQTLASSVDASVIAPGLPLVFSRSFGERISQRYAMGPFGHGWTHNWQYSLQQASDGTITILGPGGSQRIFQPDKRGGYFNQAGDSATLMATPGGGYNLTEKSGLVYNYSANGALNYIQDLNGNRITAGYTGGLLTSMTHSSGQYIRIGYNGAGLIQMFTDQLGHETVLTYDNANQHLIGAQYFDGRTATYIYNTNGPPPQLHALTASATSCCNWRYFTYDSLGRLTGTALSDNAETLTLGYGAGGQVTVTDALTNVTHFFYDHRGLLTKTVDALGHIVARTYDNSFNLVAITDPAGRSYQYAYDGLGNLIQTTDPLGNISQFSYAPAFNRLASVTDAKGNTTQYGYDSRGNLQTTTYANNSVENWTYDALGNPQTWTNRRGHQTAYTNNVNGQITDKQFADGSLTIYRYDTSGNLTNTTTFDTNLNVLEPVSMTYDASNHLAQITYPGGKFLAFTYDSNNRRTSSVDQLGHTLYYFYDDAGRLQSMTNELNALVVVYQYDPAGHIALKTLGNGLFTTYQCDPAGQLLGLTNFLADGTLLSFFNYTYDSRGRRITMNSLDGNWTYTYDDLGQLTHAVLFSATPSIPNQDLTYVYDVLGNRIQTIENGVTTTYTPNSLNQYVLVGQTNYIFDADGNVIKEVSPQGSTTYTYSDENRILAAASTQSHWNYAYDGVGDVLNKFEDLSAAQFVIDPIGLGNIVGVYDASGNPMQEYDYGLGLLARRDTNNVVLGYAMDGNGNIESLTSASGRKLDRYSYGPFGEEMQNSIMITDLFRFSGELGVFREPNGHYLMRSRSYEPSLGAFSSWDPMAYISGPSPYTYVGNSPNSFADPTGLFREPLLYKIMRQRDKDPYNPQLRDFEHFLFTEYEVQQAAKHGCVWQFAVSIYWIYGTVGYSLAKVVYFNTDLAFSGLWDTTTPTWSELENGLAGIGEGMIESNCKGGPQTQSSPLNSSPAVSRTVPVGNGTSQNLTPGDPNYLNGPAGFMTANYVLDSRLFDYQIFFENETNATAPAQIVQISNPLSTNLNWQTFQLTEIAFGNTFIAVPPNVQHFQTNLALSYAGVNFQVQIDAGINLANGQVFANFFSIDPTTGLPPSAGTGFLPPEDGTGRGIGHVSYSIQPRPNLPEGLQISNVAYIRFDENPVIATDQVNDDDPSQGISTNKMAIVTIDAIPPTSAVSPLPSIETDPMFQVCWSGTTLGAGIVAYDVYVSTNNGPWTAWLLNTTNTCGTFTGAFYQRYGFYSIAHDGAGLVQPAPARANTTTLVLPFMAPSAVTLAATNISTTNAALNASVAPNGLPTSVYFQWGATTSYGNFSGTNTLSGNAAQAVSLNATNLPSGTTIHFQVVAVSSAGTAFGGDQTLLTLAIVWINPASITYGTALGSSQLNATANVPGSFTYSPQTGSILNIGNGQTLKVTFTPTDSVHYATTSASVSLNVLANLILNGPLVFRGDGQIVGSVQQLAGDPVTLSGKAAITGDLLVPGTPSVRLSGHPTIQGTNVGAGSSQPSGYQITLDGNASLRYLRTRMDPITMPTVTPPAAPTGTRNVSLNGAGQSAGDFATIRNLSLNGNVGLITVPPGNYGSFSANGASGFILGVAGSTQPAAYAFQNLTLDGNTKVQLAGPVIVVLANSLTANGQIGTTDHPAWLQLKIAGGGLTVNGGCTLAGVVTAPSGGVTISGNSVLSGAVICDHLTIDGNGVLQGIAAGVKVASLQVGNHSGAALASVTGTRPFLSLLQVNRGENALTFSVATVPGKSYALEFTEDLSKPAWTPLEVIIGDGTVQNLTELETTRPQRYYRVVEQ